MISPKQQHAEAARRILARRKGKPYEALPGVKPSDQYDKMAEKILDKQPVTEFDAEAPAEAPGEQALEDLTKKELKNLADAAGLTYRSKATKDQLIALLTEGG